eukprot:GEZU01006589.1.p2 GENE.GEZU01006589.1~~GEZU01006589.1.p2  ORF type:complete len:262 (+),score=81.33 GEZU01006589.1:709-1494(+)
MASKLGGAPWTIEGIKYPDRTMVIGMDVYHSGEIIERKKASIVGFAASMNASMTCYYSRIVVNQPGKELITTLQPCVDSALEQFKKLNGAYPSYIIVYRDGVGEGQVKEVLDKELRELKASLKKKHVDAKICWMVVLKRINTRIFVQPDPTKSKLINPIPGTVVDTDITNHNALEFFLVAQTVNQGTATPTRYQCVYNEASFSADYLQNLTFQLCHMYYNWFGTVRVPAPCMYAHKLAFLVGQSVHTEDAKERLSDKLYYL